ncbi:MAG TPA: hypothetical protein VNO14_08530 [Blastocatellia bacterium]|nr:hypothetical protein [Blastocatellia bacterium]
MTLRGCAFGVIIVLICALSLRAQVARPADLAQKDGRIVPLLMQIADQARLSDDLSFAIEAQSEAAALLWPYDRERSRAIFRRAFVSLAPPSFKPDDDSEIGSSGAAGSGSVTAEVRRQLRADLLNRIASLDAELAEEFARMLVASVDPLKRAGAAAMSEQVERRELLISLALQVVEREPYRAMTLGQLSLSLGISPELARLLLHMRGVDRTLADLLFSSAVARLEKAQAIELADLHTLGSYLVSTMGPAGKENAPAPMIVKFLNLAYNRIMYRPVTSVERAVSPEEKTAQLEESAAVYFIGRQLTDLFARYLPGRLPYLQQRIAELSGAGSFDAEIDLSFAEATLPSDTAREARLATDEGERDALYARAALGWLERGEILEAQAAASKIADAAMRDRVLAQIARRQTSEGRIEDAVAVAQRIENGAARVGVLVKLADAALASEDRARAAELLNEAEKEAMRADPSLAQAKALLTVAASFSSFDVLRAFEVMQSAVKAINGIFPAEETPQGRAAYIGWKRAEPALNELYRLDFRGTLSALARADFDRALLLAQQLTIKEASLIAQLAVCRGVIRQAPSDSQSSLDFGAGMRH